MCLTAFWVMFAAWALYPVAVDVGLPLHLGLLETRSADRWLPQRWAFFSADPLRNSVQAVVRDEGGWHATLPFPLSSPANAFGISRRPRLVYREIVHLLGTNSIQYDVCSEPLESCLAAAASFRPITNDWRRPSLCGRMVFVLSPPVPWGGWDVMRTSRRATRVAALVPGPVSWTRGRVS